MVVQEAIKLEYEELLKPNEMTLEKIKEAFGRDDSLGIILVSGVPTYTAKRTRLLSQGPRLSALPATELSALEDPVSKYMFGWSHGKEFVNGKYDTGKGSFYANPQFDKPASEDTYLMETYPEYCHNNVWPVSLPDFEPAFKELGQLMVSVGIHIGQLCDMYLLNSLRPNDYTYEPYDGGIKKMVETTRCNKGRFLHYFASDGENDSEDGWCGWHVDHSCLTALTAPMYMMSNIGKEQEKEQEPNDEAGLYIRSKDGKVVKVEIPVDCMAFQTGEALEILTNGMLKATPHCVRAGKSSGPKVTRETLAVFMQPDWNQELRKGYKFTEYTKKTLDKHYVAAPQTI